MDPGVTHVAKDALGKSRFGILIKSSCKTAILPNNTKKNITILTLLAMRAYVVLSCVNAGVEGWLIALHLSSRGS